MPSRLLYFKKDGCPWCERMKADWEKASATLTSNPQVTTQVYDKVANPEEVKEYGVASYPTIYLETESGERIKYTGDRSARDLVEFASKKPFSLRGKNRMVLLHWYQCGHCKELMPHWDRASRASPPSISWEKYEANEDENIVQQFNVSGYPTMYAIHTDGSKKEYNGPRTVSGLMGFAAQQFNK